MEHENNIAKKMETDNLIPDHHHLAGSTKRSMGHYFPHEEVVNQLPAGILISSTRDKTVLLANPAMERITGISNRKMVGKTFSETFFDQGGKVRYPARTCRQLDRIFQDSLSSKPLSIRDLEVTLVRPDGEKRVVLMSASSLLDDKKHSEAVISILHDITERKADEEAHNRYKDELERELAEKNQDLKDANAKLSTIFNTTSESIWVCSGEGEVLSINRASETLLGIRSKDVVGKNIDALVEEGLMDQSATRKVLDTGKPISMIQTALRTEKQLLVTGTPVFDDNGSISMVIVNERDMTKLNDLEKELKQANDEKRKYKDELCKINFTVLEDQQIVAQSPEMQEVLITCGRLSAVNVSNVLLLGESGTGKGVLAEYLHRSNPALTGPLVKINCAAVPETLLEAELFGYEKGAYTGADKDGKIGLFEVAENGTLFLDEIGELPISLQAKLLYCLEEKEIMHIGGLSPIKINCNIIAATNVDLVEQVNRKTFRRDLYYRLNTFPITIPPLRRRSEDILELTLFFLKKYNEEYNLSCRIDAGELRKMQTYPFPGNVRELKNAVKKSMVMAETPSLKNILDYDNPVAFQGGAAALLKSGHRSFNDTMADIEKQILVEALEICPSTRKLASRLKMSQSQVMRKLKKHGLSHLLERNKKKKGK